MFQSQNQALLENHSNASEALANAKRNFALQSESLQEGEAQVLSEDEQEEEKEDKDSNMDVQSMPDSAKRIHEGLSAVVSSLQDLSEKAELEEQQAKRQRKAATVIEDDTKASPPALQPFGRAGGK